MFARSAARYCYNCKHTLQPSHVSPISLRRSVSDQTQAVAVDFADFEPLDEWMSKQPIEAIQKQFECQGFANIHGLINQANVPVYQSFYNGLLNDDIAWMHRHDLGNNEAQKVQNIENITQIMWPSEYAQNMDDGPFHSRANAIAKLLIGDDSVFDFDMLISKDPHTDTTVPWHQDASYWLKGITDNRALTFWCALDHASVDNGCMWFMPFSLHRQTLNELFQFENARADSHVIRINDEKFMAELNTVYDGGIPVPLAIGSCTVHHSRTPHMTKGNTTAKIRRALIANYRPKAMVEYERSNGFDHGQQGLNFEKIQKTRKSGA